MKKPRTAKQLAATRIVRKISKAERYLDNYHYRMEQMPVDAMKAKIHGFRAELQAMGARA